MLHLLLKNLDTATIRENPNICNTTLLHDMIFTKEDASTSYEHMEIIYREYNIHYRACVGSLIYILSTRVYLCFAVHK